MRKYIAAALAVICLAGCAKTPAPTEPADTQPSVTAPSVTSPTVTDPAAPDAQESAPVITDPPVCETVVTDPPATDPPVTEPPATEPPLSGWQEIDGEQYYYENGQPHTGWLDYDGDRFYFRSDGTRATGKVVMPYGDEVHYFTSTGKEVILVNPWNFVPEDYTVELEEVNGYQVSAECASALKQMLKACKEDGHSAVIVSAYRTHEYQKNLFQRRIDRFIAQGYDEATARIEAAKRVAYPGTSEHELGLAIDIVDSSYQKLNSEQENTAAQKWLMENCWEYGFILRYPNEKSDATGIIYEPWHYRYVGKELALELRDSGLCLEEYLDSLTLHNDAWSDFSLTLDGASYQLPCDYSDFAENGWVIGDDHADYQVPAHNSLAVHLLQGEKKVMVHLVNPGDEAASPATCQVDGFWLFRDYGDIEVLLPGGISSETSTAGDVLAAYGVPDATDYYGVGNDEYDPQELYYLRYEVSNMEHSIAFYFDDDQTIMEIEIKNYLPDSE